MTAARYWRVTAVRTAGEGALELSELELLNGAATLSGLTVTASVAPSAGSLAALSDGLLTADCTFDHPEASGFWVMFDAGSNKTVAATEARPCSSGDSAKWPVAWSLEYLDVDGRWKNQGSFDQLVWPGTRTRPAFISGEGAYITKVSGYTPVLYWRFEETSGTTAADTSGSGAVGTYTADAAGITGAGLLAGGGRGLVLPGTANAPSGVSRSSVPWSIGSAWTVLAIVKPTGQPIVSNVGTVIHAYRSSQGMPELDVQHVSSGLYKFRVMQAGISQLLSTGNYAYGDNQVLALVHEPGGRGVALYVGGTLVASTSTTYSAQASVDVRVGSAYFNASTDYYPIKGSVDEVSIIPSALSATAIAEVAALVAFTGSLGYTAAPWRDTAVRAITGRDLEFGGAGTLTGTTKKKGDPTDTPQKARVSILRMRDKALARQVWSDAATGDWSVAGLDTDKTRYIALAEYPDDPGNPSYLQPEAGVSDLGGDVSTDLVFGAGAVAGTTTSAVKTWDGSQWNTAGRVVVWTAP